MATIPLLQVFLGQYPLLEAVLAHIEPVDFVNLQLAGVSMPIKKKAAVDKVLKKKCQSLSGCDTTNEREALITCARIFKLEGPEAPRRVGCTIVPPPPIPHPHWNRDPESEEKPQGEEYICRKHMAMSLDEAEPYHKHAWEPVCTRHSSEISNDLSKRTLPPACFCHTERAKKELSCVTCQIATNQLLEDHCDANALAKYQEIFRRRAAYHRIVGIDPKELTFAAALKDCSDMDPVKQKWRKLRPTAPELWRTCPLEGCEEDSCWEKVDGQLHVIYCIACRSFFQIADFAELEE